LPRLENNFNDRNKEAVRETLQALEDRHARGYVSDADYGIIVNSLKLALDDRWEEAQTAVGLQPSKAQHTEPNEPAPLKPSGSVSAHGIEIPLPEGAKIISHKPGKPPIDDDVWRVQLDDAKRVRSFYAQELASRGWHLDARMEDTWTKARARSTTNEFIVIGLRAKDFFEIRVAP